MISVRNGVKTAFPCPNCLATNESFPTFKSMPLGSWTETFKLLAAICKGTAGAQENLDMISTLPLPPVLMQFTMIRLNE